MFPSPEFIEICVEHREFVNGLWEPSVGDWFVSSPSGVSGIAWWDEPYRAVSKEEEQDAVWLPRPDQLMETLEERGYNDWHLHCCIDDPEEGLYYQCDAYGDKNVEVFGPDPACALLKALLAVEKEEK